MTVWPFPPFPLPEPKDNNPPWFNPDNFESANARKGENADQGFLFGEPCKKFGKLSLAMKGDMK